MGKVLIAGGGAAGMMAAIMAARNGQDVHVFEKNDRLGKKLFITGKGRCNVTNASDMENLFDSVRANSKFLYSAFYSFSNERVMELFEELGVRLKVERGNRVFPVSDHSSDIVRALQKECDRLGVNIYLNSEITNITVQEDTFSSIQLKNGEWITGDALILATGGVSYPLTGSTGEGIQMAEKLGHKIVELTPSLIPMVTKEDWVKELQGLSLKNVTVTIKQGKKQLYSDFGEMLFTHFGISGPLILSGSSYVTSAIKKGSLDVYIDLKPALTEEQLDARLLREFDEAKNKQFKNVLNGLFPQKLIPIMIRLSGITPEKKVNEITKEERNHFGKVIKNLPLTVTALRGIEEAIITRGGVSVKEVNPSTMESKKIQNLYFAGEMLDLDALTGGYNLQIAWSTGYLAGQNAGIISNVNGGNTNEL